MTYYTNRQLNGMMQEYGSTAKLLSDFDILNQVSSCFNILFSTVAHLSTFLFFIVGCVTLQQYVTRKIFIHNTTISTWFKLFFLYFFFSFSFSKNIYNIYQGNIFSNWFFYLVLHGL